ncbi:MAG: Tad domain-containing protein, partial [Anaerolineaceae bacterium]
MKRALDTQRGQVIILFVLALVGLLAFAGLAIDGAMVYSDRRVAQSSSDSAALAGAGAAGTTMQLRNIHFFADDKNEFYCDEFNVAGSKMNAARLDAIDAAVQRAGVNGFTIDNDLSDANGITIRCFDDSNPG